MEKINNRRVLIVDDNRAIHDDFKKILAPDVQVNRLARDMESALFGDAEELPQAPAEPFLVVSAYQGQEALELVREASQNGRPYAVAFIDVRMPPGWDGIQTTSEIWKVDPNIHVVICTAYSDYSWSQMMTKLGQSDRLVVLKKPFDNVEALQLAHALATKWELSRQARQRLEELDRLVGEKTEQLRSANKKLLDDLNIRKQTELRLAAFATLGNRLSTAQDPKTAAEIIVGVADELLGWDACVCDLYSAADDQVNYVLNTDTIDGRRKEFPPEKLTAKPGSFARKAINEGGQLILRNIGVPASTNSVPFGDKSRPSASILYVPIRNGQSVIGFLSIQSYTPNAYDQHSLETFQALTDHCAGALNRIKSEAALHQTEQQLRQSQKMEAVGQLAGGVAHDFNNLLAVIMSNAELVGGSEPSPSADAAESLKEIIDAVERAGSLTRQLLAFSRKQVVQSKPLHLNQHLNSLSGMLKRIIGEDIQLQGVYAENLPLVQADPSMMDQVIMNLVVNARDAMPRGGRLQLSTEFLKIDSFNKSEHPESRAGQFACIKVADSGVGIAPENLSRIFEPFFTTKDIGKGSGLGLATVFGIVKQHNGWIEVSSQLGVGTTFQIFLPALDVDPLALAAGQDANIKQAAPRGDGVILLVEDEDAVRKVTRRVLEEAGYETLPASSGEEALKIWAGHQQRIDLLLTDLIMPGGINGRALAERLAAAKPGLKAVFMSGYSADILEDIAEFFQDGKNRLVKKPFSRLDLLHVIREQLDACETLVGR